MDIPDAPWIQETESRGTDYVGDWLWGAIEPPYEEEEEEEDDY